MKTTTVYTRGRTADDPEGAMFTKRDVRKAAKAAKGAAVKLEVMTDEVLVKAGKAAERRQQHRAVTKALKTAGTVALVAGATAATAVAVRAGVHRLREK